MGISLLPDKCRDSVIGNQCDAAQFPALPNPNEPPISKLLALVVVTSP